MVGIMYSYFGSGKMKERDYLCWENVTPSLPSILSNFTVIWLYWFCSPVFRILFFLSFEPWVGVSLFLPLFLMAESCDWLDHWIRYCRLGEAGIWWELISFYIQKLFLWLMQIKWISAGSSAFTCISLIMELQHISLYEEHFTFLLGWCYSVYSLLSHSVLGNNLSILKKYWTCTFALMHVYII